MVFRYNGYDKRKRDSMPYQLRPVLKSKMWGGQKLKRLFNFENKEDNIGECWGISGYEGSESILVDGSYADRRFLGSGRTREIFLAITKALSY